MALPILSFLLPLSLLLLLSSAAASESPAPAPASAPANTSASRTPAPANNTSAANNTSCAAPIVLRARPAPRKAYCTPQVTSLHGLAEAALNLSRSRARKASNLLHRIKAHNRWEKGALRACIELMSESMSLLDDTRKELQYLRRGTESEWHLRNAEKWVGAAERNEIACLVGFKEIDGHVRADLKRAILKLSKVTTIALYVIKSLDV